ncbi:MAG: hypothetical protein WD270_11890 [Acetobacterales bacterium]
MSRKPATEPRFRDIAGLIRRARRDLKGGTPVDLTGLDTTMAALCEAVVALPKEQADALKPRLIALKDELDDLETRLREGHEALGRELRQLSSRAQAMTAYARPPKK